MSEVQMDNLKIYYDMLLARRLEEKAGQLYTQGKIGGFCHLYIGQEAVAVGAISALRQDDYVIAGYREHVHALQKGISANKVMAELVGTSDGISKGKGGSMHMFDNKSNFLGGHGIVGGHLPIAAGVGYSIKYRKTDQVILVFLGDGAVNIGAFHETLNVVELWDLPVVFLVENNQYGMGTPVSKASALIDIFQRACSYGIYGKFVDGMDVRNVFEVTSKAVQLARTRGKATLIEAKTYRYRGHSMSDPALYRTKEELQQYKDRDPIARFKHYLLENGLLTPEQDKELSKKAKQEVDASIKYAEAGSQPELSELYTDVYVD